MDSRYTNFSPRLGTEREKQFTKQFMTLSAWYYKSLIEDGDMSRAFYDVDIKDLKEFIDIVYDPNILFYLVLDKENKNLPVGHFILNSFQGKCAQIHINILKANRNGDSVNIGIDAIRQIFEVQRADGVNEPMLKSLMGLIPQDNKDARNYAVWIGFRRVAKIVEGCYMEQEGRFTHGILYLLNNEGWKYGTDNRSGEAPRRAA